MKIWQTTQPNKTCDGNIVNGGYVSIYDDGFQAERNLFITDDDGNTVCLKNEQIGELYKRIKPTMAG